MKKKLKGLLRTVYVFKETKDKFRFRLKSREGSYFWINKKDVEIIQMEDKRDGLVPIYKVQIPIEVYEEVRKNPSQ